MTFSVLGGLNEVEREGETAEKITPFILIYANFPQKESQLFHYFWKELQFFRESPFQFIYTRMTLSQSEILLLQKSEYIDQSIKLSVKVSWLLIYPV